MPDLTTHLAAAYLVAETKQNISQEAKTLFLIGNLLPDLLTRPLNVAFPRLCWLFAPLHTPVGLILVCGLVTYAFEKRLRGVVFRALALGVGLHLLLDALQKRVTDVYGILFPFAWKDIYIGVFWPDQSLWALPFLLIASAVMHWWRRTGANR